MKNFVSNLVALAATLLIDGILGIPMATTLAVLISFILIEHIVYIVYTHVKDKTMPSALQWAQYALELATLILVVCGINYRSIYTVIFGLITAVAALVIHLVRNKKAKEVAVTEEA